MCLFLDLFQFKLGIHMCVPLCEYVHVSAGACPWRPEDVIWSPGAGVTSVCELISVLWVLCNSNPHSHQLNPLFRANMFVLLIHIHSSQIDKKKAGGAKGLVSQLAVLAALSENLVSIPNTHGSSQPSVATAPENTSSLFWPFQAPGVYVAYCHTRVWNIHCTLSNFWKCK